MIELPLVIEDLGNGTEGRKEGKKEDSARVKSARSRESSNSLRSSKVREDTVRHHWEVGGVVSVGVPDSDDDGPSDLVEATG